MTEPQYLANMGSIDYLYTPISVKVVIVLRTLSTSVWYSQLPYTHYKHIPSHPVKMSRLVSQKDMNVFRFFIQEEWSLCYDELKVIENVINVLTIEMVQMNSSERVMSL